MSETTDATAPPRSRRRITLVGLGVVVVVAAVAVVSALTGGTVTDGKTLPTTKLVGTHVASFTLPRLGGGTAAMPWATHHPSVLIFFASWCPPCKGEMPKLATYLRHHDTGDVDVVGIDANDERSAATTFVAKDDVTFPVVFDDHGDVTSGTFGFGQLPETVFLNAQGVVKNVHFGALSTTQLKSGIKELRSP